MAKLALLVDDFATADAAKWTYNSGAGAADGQLILPCTSGYTNVVSAVSTWDLTASSMTVEVIATPPNGTGTTQLGLALYNAGQTDAIAFFLTGTTLEAQTRTSSVDTTRGSGVTFNPVNHRWLRISEAGGTVTWATSPDRQAWTTFTTWASDITMTAFLVQINCGYYGTELSPGAAVLDNFNVDPGPRVSVGLTHVGSTTWVAPASSVTATPTYPASLNADDAVYAFLHVKPSTATVASPTNWFPMGSFQGGAGTQAADTGATRVFVFRRAATGGLSGSQAFTITGGSSPTAFMRAYRATSGSNTSFEETFTSWSVGTASTTIGGTADASLRLAANDEICAVIGSPSDGSTTLTLTGLTATGATLGALTRDPNATVINAQGNDSSATAYRIPVTAGSSTSAPVATATSNTSVTALGFLMRVRAMADDIATGPVLPVPQPYTARRRAANY